MVQSIMYEEVYTFDEAYKAAHVAANDLRTIHDTNFTIQIFTNSKQFFDAVA